MVVILSVGQMIWGRVTCRMMDEFSAARISAPGVVDSAVA